MTDETINTEHEHSEEMHGNDLSTHEYDGIIELNNPAPYWILLIFIATFGFSMFYVIEYFGYPDNGKDQKSEYEKEMATAKERAASNKGNSGKTIVLDEKQQLASGAKLFSEKGCIACHGMNGEGNNIGPNLTDKYWINGCKEENVVKIITDGKPEKGMTPFKSSLTEEQIKQVAAYVLKSLAGTNPANAKAPQGDVCN